MSKRHTNRVGDLESLFLRLEELVLANSGADEFEEIFKLVIAKLWDERSGGPTRFKAHNSRAETTQAIRALLREGSKAWPGVLHFEITNSGKGEFVQLWTEMRSASLVVNGLRAYLGLVKPGEKVERCLAAILPLDTPSDLLDAELIFHEANGHAPAKIPIRFDVQPLPRPDFLVRYRLINDDSDNSVGNGDGQPKRGETIDVAVHLDNGTGEALSGVRVSLRAVQVPDGVAVSVERIIGRILGSGLRKHRSTTLLIANLSSHS